MTRVLVLDGGMGRELMRMGAPFRQPEWSALALIEAPDAVRAAHVAFARAGAEVLTTNAYAVVPFHIGEARFAADGTRLAALAAALARSVADEFGVRVAGSLPPALGSYRPDLFVADRARPIVEVLVAAQAGDVDVWLAETVSSVAEVRLVRAVLDDRGDHRPLWVSFTLDDEHAVAGRAGDGPARLRSGELVADAVEAAVALGAEMVAFNCSQPEVMEAAVGVAAAVTDVAIGVYANVFDQNDHEHYEGANAGVWHLRGDVSPVRYREFAERWVAAGATVVGGCCGVGPAHVSALSARWPRG
ncbi:MAG TPA: homocysteine S-methyltransferase family protein [Ilumatobacter sp.]|nr:homocysteine S-methyltransferase family protein [Ilumatobacter sp.]